MTSIIMDSQDDAMRSKAMVMIESQAEKVERAISARAAIKLKRALLCNGSFEKFGDDWEVILKTLLEAHSFALILSQVKHSRKEKRTEYTKDVICQKADICGLDDQYKYMLCNSLGFDYEKPIYLLRHEYYWAKRDFDHAKRMADRYAIRLSEPDLPQARYDFYAKKYSKSKEQFEAAESKLNELASELASRGEPIDLEQTIQDDDVYSEWGD